MFPSTKTRSARLMDKSRLCQALKNAPLKSFKSDTKSGSSSKKDVEEYVATIDDYREAVERLRKTQEARAELETKIDNSDDLREKILWSVS